MNGFLSTDVYQKPTDTHNYLQYDSSHPQHCIRSIPYSQFTRLKRIVSEPETLKRRISEFTEYFANSGYPRSLLKKVSNQVLNQGNQIDKQKEHVAVASTKVVTTFNVRLPNLKDLIEKHWNIIQTNGKCREVLTSPSQVIYSRAENLSNKLVRAKYRSNKGVTESTQPSKVRSCNRCSWCTKMVEGTEFKSVTTGRKFQIRHNMHCTSEWVVYLCECVVHKKQYVGKSETKLNIRMNNNRNHMALKDPSCKLVQHFQASSTCDFKEDLKIMPIEQLSMATDVTKTKEEKRQVLIRREIFWQNTLKTFYPDGMNKREG